MCSFVIVIPPPLKYGKTTTFMHEHYLYKMRFNDIKKLNCNTRCDLADQKGKMSMQGIQKYWKANKNEEFIAFCKATHCALVETSIEAIHASTATAERRYNLLCVPTAESLGLAVAVSMPSYITSNVDFFFWSVTHFYCRLTFEATKGQHFAAHLEE